MKKETKPYNEKLHLNTTFEDAISVCLNLTKPKPDTLQITTEKVTKKKWKWAKNKDKPKK